MSIGVMQDVWRYSRTNGNDRLVLLALADVADDDQRLAWPSVATLASKANIDARTVQRVLKRLIESGELVLVREGGFVNGKPKASVYRLPLLDADPPANRRGLPGTGAAPTQDSSSSRSGVENGVVESESGGSRESARKAPPAPKPVPVDFPEALREPLTRCHGILHRLATAKGVPPLDEGRVAEGMAHYPDRDHVAVAMDLEDWLTVGKGQNKAVKSLAQWWRNFLRGAAPAGSLPGKSANADRVEATIQGLRAGRTAVPRRGFAGELPT